MIAFEVKDMNCGHCVGAISDAVRAADSGAKVQFDLAMHRVNIEPGHANTAQLRAAIQAAGYSPAVIELTGAAGEATQTCCGGGCRCL